MSFLSDAEYRTYLDERIRCVDDPIVREHVSAKFEAWAQRYRTYRLLERASELLISETQRPKTLFLSCKADLDLLRILAQHHRFDKRLFRGFLVEDSLWDSVQPEWFSPFSVCRVSDWRVRMSIAACAFACCRSSASSASARRRVCSAWAVSNWSRAALTASSAPASWRWCSAWAVSSRRRASARVSSMGVVSNRASTSP